MDNGDDSLSLKANSTDITITNSTFYHGLGIAIGSIGQYKGAFETVQRAHAKNNVFYKTTHAAYFKTWTGEQVGYPPNGGGGGLGCKFLLPYWPYLCITEVLTMIKSPLTSSLKT